MIFDVVNFGVAHSLENLAHDFISFKLFSSAYCAISPSPPPSHENGGGWSRELGGGGISQLIPNFIQFFVALYFQNIRFANPS